MSHCYQLRFLKVWIDRDNVINRNVERSGNADERVALLYSVDFAWNLAGCRLRDFQLLSGMKDERLRKAVELGD